MAEKCARCGLTLLPACVSLYFCDYWCQKRWYMERLASDADRRIAEPGLPIPWSVA